MSETNQQQVQNYPLAEKLMAYTHVVENQPPTLENYNQYSLDIALTEAVKREGADWANERLIDFGTSTGSREKIELGRLANVARAASFYLQMQVEAGHLCPITMTEKQGGSDVRTNTTKAQAIGVTGRLIFLSFH